MAEAATTNPNGLAESFKAIITEFRASLYRHGHLHRAAMPLISLLLQYLTRAAARFAIASQRGPAPPRKPAQNAPTQATTRVRKPSPFPTKFAWALALLPPTPISGALAGGARNVLIGMLATPDLIALVETNPSIGRFFRPLCRIFGVKQPDYLKRRNASTAPAANPITAPTPETSAVTRTDGGAPGFAAARQSTAPRPPNFKNPA